MTARYFCSTTLCGMLLIMSLTATSAPGGDYLATLEPNMTDSTKLAVMSGAVIGGGLTVIANAPNPAGQSILNDYFDEGISPLGLLLGALPPTVLMTACFLLLPNAV